MRTARLLLAAPAATALVFTGMAPAWAGDDDDHHNGDDAWAKILEIDDEAGSLQEQFRLPELEGRYGRIRSVLQGQDGALYVTTDNGSASDLVLRVIPRG